MFLRHPNAPEQPKPELCKLRLVNKYSVESREVPSPYYEIPPTGKFPTRNGSKEIK